MIKSAYTCCTCLYSKLSQNHVYLLAQRECRPEYDVNTSETKGEKTQLISESAEKNSWAHS